MTTIKKYLSLVKFAHTIFALPFALIGFFLGNWKPIRLYSTVLGFYTPEFKHKSQISDVCSDDSMLNQLITGANPQFTIIKYFLLVMGCMVFARSAAMAFNRYLDAKYDALNPRTAIREIPSGAIKPSNALTFTIISCLAFIGCTFFINRLCFYLAPVALIVILFYSYTKRFTALCHLILGLGLSLAPIGGYLAVTGVFALLPILFSITVLCWVSGFDVIYALQDESFDKQYHLHSIPVALGKIKALRFSAFLHLLAAASLVGAGLYGSFGIWYWIGATIFCGLLIYQHLLVKPNDLSKVNMAFFTTNGIASVVFAIFVILDLFLGK